MGDAPGVGTYCEMGRVRAAARRGMGGGAGEAVRDGTSVETVRGFDDGGGVLGALLGEAGVGSIATGVGAEIDAASTSGATGSEGFATGGTSFFSSSFAGGATDVPAAANGSVTSSVGVSKESDKTADSSSGRSNDSEGLGGSDGFDAGMASS